MAHTSNLYSPSTCILTTGTHSRPSSLRYHSHLRLSQGRIEHLCRRREPTLQCPEWSVSTILPEPVHTIPHLHNFSAANRERRHKAINDHISSSSQISYGCGRTHFLAICAKFDIPIDSLFHASTSDIHALLENFVDYVRHSRIPPIRSSTINCYVTHVNDWFITANILSSSFSIRSQRLNFLLQSYSLHDFQHLPIRQKTAVPFTYSLLCEAFLYIDTLSLSVNTRAFIKAAFALGYACSLRTSQYLKGSHSTPLRKQCNSSVSYFWFGDTPLCICDPQLFPVDTLPDAFSCLLQYSKNDKHGIGGPKAIYRCSTVSPERDCLTVLFRYLYFNPPQRDSSILSNERGQINASKHIRPVLNHIADKYGFQRSQLLIHSSIRSGALVALTNEPNSVKATQGCWTTIQGMSNYLRGTLDHAKHVSPLLHDNTICSITTLQNIYLTQDLRAHSSISPPAVASMV